jgi:3-hydroxyisobutyrate dehydrogenase-like beta-hydroxyacid dehydrogenase
MRLGIIGAGHIGGNIARRAALAGYDVTVSFARDRVYGEEYRQADAEAVVTAVRAGRPIPPVPSYS